MKRYTKGIFQLSCVLLIALSLGAGITHADSGPRLRIIHVATGLPNVDIYWGDTILFQNVFYKYISDYIPVTSDSNPRKFRVLPFGEKPVNFQNIPFGETPGFIFEGDQDFTVVAAGNLRSITYFRLVDDNNNLPGIGTSKVKIVHAAFDTPATEFCLTDVCHTLAYREYTDYFLMDPGTYTLSVRLNGTDLPYLEVPPLHLQDNSIQTIFLTGHSYGQPGLQLLYSYDAGDIPNPVQPPAGPAGDVPSTAPPPAYPPTTGVFLSPKLMGLIAGVVLVVAGGVGFWVIRK
jgi:hypothetical protein